MRKFFTLIIIVLSLSSQTVSAQCNPAFTFTVNHRPLLRLLPQPKPRIAALLEFWDGYAQALVKPPITHIILRDVQRKTCYTWFSQYLHGFPGSNVTVTTTATCQASFVTSYDSVNYNYGVYCYSTSTYSGTGIQTYTWSVNGVVQGGNNSYLYFTPSPTAAIIYASLL